MATTELVYTMEKRPWSKVIVGVIKIVQKGLTKLANMKYCRSVLVHRWV